MFLFKFLLLQSNLFLHLIFMGIHCKKVKRREIKTIDDKILPKLFKCLIVLTISETKDTICSNSKAKNTFSRRDRGNLCQNRIVPNGNNECLLR